MGSLHPSPSSDDAGDSDEYVEERPWRQLLRHGSAEDGPPQLTVRAAVAGISIGTLLCAAPGHKTKPDAQIPPIAVRP